MPKAIVRLALLGALLGGAFFSGRIALASASSVEDLLAGGLVPSAAPGLLGPIASVGRKGWDCQPEHAASSVAWKGGELPSAPDSH